MALRRGQKKAAKKAQGHHRKDAHVPQKKALTHNKTRKINV